LIIGFISGSLGIVWPWKEKIFKTEAGNYLLDSKGHKITENYKRYIPDISQTETWATIAFIAAGIGLLLLIDYYGKDSKKQI